MIITLVQIQHEGCIPFSVIIDDIDKFQFLHMLIQRREGCVPYMPSTCQLLEDHKLSITKRCKFSCVLIKEVHQSIKQVRGSPRINQTGNGLHWFPNFLSLQEFFQ